MEQPLDILRPGISFPALKTLLPDMLPEDGQFGGLHSEELSDPFVYDLIE